MQDDPQNNGGMGGDQPQTPAPQPPMPGSDGDTGGDMPTPGGDTTPGGDAPAPAPQDPGVGGEDAPHGDDSHM